MASANEEKREICDCDGSLIYKLKRCRLDLTVSIEGLPLSVEISDSSEKSWRDRKSKMLLKLKARYRRLMEQREILSSRMGRGSNFQERQREWGRDEAMKNFNEEVAFGSLMKEEVEEGLLKQRLINLPIWGSPYELMASLCHIPQLDSWEEL